MFFPSADPWTGKDNGFANKQVEDIRRQPAESSPDALALDRDTNSDTIAPWQGLMTLLR